MTGYLYPKRVRNTGGSPLSMIPPKKVQQGRRNTQRMKRAPIFSHTLPSLTKNKLRILRTKHSSICPGQQHINQKKIHNEASNHSVATGGGCGCCFVSLTLSSLVRNQPSAVHLLALCLCLFCLCVSFCLFLCVPVCRCACLPVCVSVSPSLSSPSVCLSVHLPTHAWDRHMPL